MNLPFVAIVCATYNRRDMVAALLRQLRSLDYPRELRQIFVVDNASTDATADLLRGEFPEVQLAVCPRNLGGSAGFNLGMRQALADARSELIWLVDDDAQVEAGTLRPLVAAMQEDERLGIAGSAIYDPAEPERLVTAGVRLDWRTGRVALNKHPPGGGELVDADLIPACSLLVRSALCREIGLWDERFWVYWGDTDWCLRALRRGYRVRGHLGSRTWHRDWANTARSFAAPAVLYDDLRGALLCNVRHAPRGALDGVRRLLAKAYAKAAVEHLSTRPGFSAAVEAATDDFLGGRFRRGRYEPAPPPARPETLQELCRRLAHVLPQRPHVLLDGLEAQKLAEVRAALQLALRDARFEVRPPRPRARREDFNTDYAGMLRHDLPQLAARLLGRRRDLVVTPLDTPRLYTVFAARHGILLGGDMRGVLQDHQALRASLRCGATFVRGLKAAWWDLPRALRRNHALQSAIADPEGLHA